MGDTAFFTEHHRVTIHDMNTIFAGYNETCSFWKSLARLYNHCHPCNTALRLFYGIHTFVKGKCMVNQVSSYFLMAEITDIVKIP